MNILQRSMASQGILNDTQTTLADYLMSIAQISVEDAGAIYIELSSIRGNFMANIILRIIENYHFLPDMAQKLKNKQALVESVIANEQLEPSITSSIKDVYDDLVNSKNENEKCPLTVEIRLHRWAGISNKTPGYYYAFRTSAGILFWLRYPTGRAQRWKLRRHLRAWRP